VKITFIRLLSYRNTSTQHYAKAPLLNFTLHGVV